MSSDDFALTDANWLAHRYVESADQVRFLRVVREQRAQLPFLTDACLGQDVVTHDLASEICLAEARPGPLHYIFHSAYCGSTMLVRAFDRPGLAAAMSEPMILNDVVGFHRRGARAAAVARCADVATRLLARPFAADRAVVVKPSNVINPLAELLLALQPRARAIFLFAPLETFLVSVARKGLGCRLWVRELAEGYLSEGYLAPVGFSPAEIFRQTDLQIAAVGWLAQMHHFTALRDKLGPDRIALLDSEAMTAAPAHAVAAVARHYGLPVGTSLAAEIAAGPAFTRHSKTGEAYSRHERQTDYAAARAAHGEEIAAVTAWAEQVADAAEIDLDPADRLIQA